MKSKFDLFYFTNSFPYGIGEQWKFNELNVLKKYFNNIHLIPYHYNHNFNNPAKIPQGIIMHKPLFKDDQISVKKHDLFKFILHPKRLLFFKEFFNKKVYKNKKHLIDWFISTNRAILLLRHPTIIDITKKSNENCVWYFYWGKGSAEILPFVQPIKMYKSFVRMHRYDLFEYVNNNYIPYRKFLLQSSNIISPSSYAGKEHLDYLYPSEKEKIKVFRCGTVGNSKSSEPSNDGVFRIVSCALLSPVKRVDIMIQALSLLPFEVEWHHIGDGFLRKELEFLVKKLDLTDKFIFHGMLDSSKVLDFYTSNSFDVFINVSQSEGVPFSIMESFAAGIPVIATDVGGNSEIVNNETGKLLKEDITPNLLAEEITKFKGLPDDVKVSIRNACVQHYTKYWNAEKLANELGIFLISK